MSIREKSTIQIVASEAARRHYRQNKINANNNDRKMKSAIDVRPLGEDWKHLKRELSYGNISKAEESFFEEQFQREYRRLKQDGE